MAIRIHVDTRIERFVQAKLTREEFRNLEWRTMARAKRDLARLHVRHQKKQIRAKHQRHTGTLLRSPRMIVRQFRRNGNPVLRLLPNFPMTRYDTPPGRGRRDSSKQGQYAFVLSAASRFIEFAKYDAERDPEASRIIRKHYLFILRQILAGR